MHDVDARTYLGNNGGLLLHHKNPMSCNVYRHHSAYLASIDMLAYYLARGRLNRED